MDASRIKAKEWLDPFFDETTRNTVEKLLNESPEELEESFYKNLEFGTGGMRGIMGVGTNRINNYTIGKATLGLAHYIKDQSTSDKMSVAIAYDSRNRSSEFAKIAAKVLAANGIKAYLFSELRPTPVLSYAVRTLKCDAGIVITASHNPKEYNGYKVYWNDGGQLVFPHDKGVMDAVNAISSFNEINFEGPGELIEMIDSQIDDPYKEAVKGLVKGNNKTNKSIGVVFTSLHGTGITMIPDILKELSYQNIHLVKDQSEPDGNFPTVESPNPEERSALAKAIELAKITNAELVLGTDPDADRVGLAIKDNTGEWILLNGNQAGSILVNYLLESLDASLYNSSFICKTIVTTDLIEEIASSYKVKCFNTLTGFKYISQIIKQFEGELSFIGGGEESFGYLVGDFVRDKDAVISSVLFTHIAAKCQTDGITLYDYLLSIYKKYGVYKERLVSMTKKGKSGLLEIKNMMESYRSNTPKELAGEKVVEFSDYQEGVRISFPSGESQQIDLDQSNVLQFRTEKGSLITVRPSGTEPKIKFYFSVKEKKGIDVLDGLVKAENHLDQLEKAFV